MNKKLVVFGLILVTFMVPTVLSDAHSGTYEGTHSADIVGAIIGEMDIDDVTFVIDMQSQNLLREYTADALSDNSTGPWQVDFTPYPLGTHNTISATNSRTFITWTISYRMTPSVGNPATFSAYLAVDGNSVCGGIFSMLSAGAVQSVQEQTRTCRTDYLIGTHTLDIVTPTTQNTDNIRGGFEVKQTEHYSRAILQSGGLGDHHSAPITLSAFTLRTTNGVESGQIFNGSVGGGPLEPSDHNVTIIDGDTNVPAMRVYAWVVGFTAFLIVLAEWKKDIIYYFLSLLALIYVAIETPAFFPERMLFIPLVVGMYMAYRIYVGYRGMRMGEARLDD